MKILLRRFDLGSPAMGGSMDENEDGDYVWFDDVKPALVKIHAIEALFGTWSSIPRDAWTKERLYSALKEINEIIYP